MNQFSSKQFMIYQNKKLQNDNEAFFYQINIIAF
jgi:hypothetical protein